MSATVLLAAIYTHKQKCTSLATFYTPYFMHTVSFFIYIQFFFKFLLWWFVACETIDDFVIHTTNYINTKDKVGEVVVVQWYAALQEKIESKIFKINCPQIHVCI